jgi:hypothetical protein
MLDANPLRERTPKPEYPIRQVVWRTFASAFMNDDRDVVSLFTKKGRQLVDNDSDPS